MRNDFSRRYDKIQGGQMKVIQFPQGDQHYRINPETGAGHVSDVDGEFDPAFEPTARSVMLDVIGRPFITEARPVTTVPIDPAVFVRTLQSAADLLRSNGGGVEGTLAQWLEKIVDSVDVDPFAPDYQALAAEEPQSQYQDAVDAAGYRTW